MKHLGDITKISGYTAPVVDCIIGGSPCQDLSVAGKRAGLDGERSGLYMEQIRIVKEMREQDARNGRSGVDIRPRYMVWENVPGAFSSNKGEDFRIVLEELAKVKEPSIVIPKPEKWTNHGSIVGNGWSIAWRVLDAQFWGTSDKPLPQRRRRIALVADFGGESAPEILFVREGVSGHIEPGEPQRKEAPSDASRGVGADDCLGADQYNAVILGDTVSTLGVNCGMSHGRQCVLEPMAFGISSYDSNAMKSPNPNSGIYEAETSRTLDGNGGNPACNQGGIAVVETQAVIYDARGNGSGEVCPTLVGDHQNRVTDFTSLACQVVRPSKAEVYSIENHPGDSRVGINEDEMVQTLKSRMGTGGGNVSMVMALDRATFNQGKNAKFDFEVSTKGVSSPLVAKGPSAVCYAVDQGGGKSGVDVREGKAPTLTTTHDGAPAVCYGINGDKAGTLDASYYKGCGLRSGLEREVVAVPAKTRYIVRRLTPLECERLQGYPDNWTRIGEVIGYERQVDESGNEYVQAIYEYIDANGKKRKTSDAARYKALGNSIALPPWKWVLKRLCACYERDATMASLFDGIGGFPYLWEQLNGKGSCLWASEIEEFPMAVTKVRIGE